jgi:hypothetical protein
MGYIIYRCSDDLPAKIPEILSGLSSPATSEGGPWPESKLERSYRYDVKRGMGRISIYGSREDGFMSVVIVSGSLNPFRGRASLELSIDATKALLDAGMEEITVEDLEQLEAQREQEEAEQAAAGATATSPPVIDDPA